MSAWPEHRKKAAVYFAVAAALLLTAGWVVYGLATHVPPAPAAGAPPAPSHGRVKGGVMLIFGLLTVAGWAFNTGAYYWSDWADRGRRRK